MADTQDFGSNPRMNMSATGPGKISLLALFSIRVGVKQVRNFHE